MKRKLLIWLILILALESAGCSTVQKKFTRKKKEKYVPKAIYIEEGTYQKKFSNAYYYKTHFTFWSTWHDDLIQQIGGNQKSLRRAAEESINHLTEMHHYLSPVKQAELQPILDELTRITDKIRDRSLSESEEPGVRTDLERIKRLVVNDFYFNKIQESLSPEEVTL